MDLRDMLHEGGFKAQLQSTTKDGLIRELVELLVEAEGLGDPEAILDCILERESQMSTGMQQGIAIPHGKTASVTQLHAAVGVKAEGMDFQALDGKPSQIFIVTVCPPDAGAAHIKFLSEVSKRLNDADMRANVIAAKTFPEFIGALDGAHAHATA